MSGGKPEGVQTILIGGCPRSGTSWLHFLLASHPAAASVRETHLYDKYLGPLSEWFLREDVLQGRDGLTALFTEEQFEREVLAPIVDTVWSRILDTNPDATFLVEKTPSNILHHRLIGRLQPDVRLVFVLRDPRGVAASYKAAGREGWGGWAKKPLADVCSSWNLYSTAYATARRAWNDEHLRVVRFEELAMKTEARLRALFAWTGMEHDDEMIGRIVEENAIDKLRQAEDDLRSDKRQGFYRKGNAFGWSAELTLAEIREIEHRCANFMAYWGYRRHVPRQSD